MSSGNHASEVLLLVELFAFQGLSEDGSVTGQWYICNVILKISLHTQFHNTQENILESIIWTTHPLYTNIMQTNTEIFIPFLKPLIFLLRILKRVNQSKLEMYFSVT